MKTNLKIAIVSSILLLLGGITASAQQDAVSSSEQLIAMCRGGGYPVLVCEIIDGKRVCHRECPEPDDSRG